MVAEVADEEDPVSSRLERVLAYHQRTKHHPHRFARSAGFMDWDSQPDPFRRFDGARVLPLRLTDIEGGPGYGAVMGGALPTAASLDIDFVSHLLRDSLSLSAWKQHESARWALRVNPSSGNLHPTEGYLIAPAIPDLSESAAVYHYAPREHALERRCTLSDDEWRGLSAGLPDGALFFAFTSIHWRESWKYGERAFRYCHHDLGHAMAAVGIAAAALGWRTALLPSVTDDALAALLGLPVSQERDPEAEEADCLLLLYSGDVEVETIQWRDFELPVAVLDGLDGTRFEGKPNRLSPFHEDWSVIDEVARASRKRRAPSTFLFGEPAADVVPVEVDDRGLRPVVHQRRSAVRMDGETRISADAFFDMMTSVGGGPALSAIPWSPRIDLCLFVHRVDDVAPGLYVLVRDPARVDVLKSATDADLRWEKPAGAPDSLPLYLLEARGYQALAGAISCRQHGIAADGVFALGMLADYLATMDVFGPWAYRMLHWEAGAVGQILYLAAEAHGIRSTGIGCYFDDGVPEVLKLADRSHQVLYHFTLGGAVEDPRLTTHPPYEDLVRSDP